MTNLTRCVFPAAVLVLHPLGSLGANTATFTLFTDKELKEWSSYTKDHVDEESTRSKALTTAPATDCHAAPDAAALASSSPQINILKPVLTNPLSAPIDIEVTFVPAGSAPIDPASFRVCYIASFFTKDITDRIAGHATVSAGGIRVAGADLPRGHHHLMLLIADAQGHTGRREATFDIK